MLKARLRFWLEDILRHNKPYRSNGRIPLRRHVHSVLTITLTNSLRFLSFVLERGKNPENPGCLLGMKIFRKVGNFWKTDIYEWCADYPSKGATIKKAGGGRSFPWARILFPQHTGAKKFFSGVYGAIFFFTNSPVVTFRQLSQPLFL